MQSYSKQMLKSERSIYEVVIMEYQIPVIYLLLNFLLMFKNSKKSTIFSYFFDFQRVWTQGTYPSIISVQR